MAVSTKTRRRLWYVHFAEVAEDDPGISKGELISPLPVSKVERSDNGARDVWLEGLPIASRDWDRLRFSVLFV